MLKTVIKRDRSEVPFKRKNCTCHFQSRYRSKRKRFHNRRKACGRGGKHSTAPVSRRRCGCGINTGYSGKRAYRKRSCQNGKGLYIIS